MKKLINLAKKIKGLNLEGNLVWSDLISLASKYLAGDAEILAFCGDLDAEEIITNAKIVMSLSDEKIDEIKEFVSENFNKIKRKSTAAGKMEAERDFSYGAARYIKTYTEEALMIALEGSTAFKWLKIFATGEIVTNSFGKHLYFKKGSF